jgi:hypothetical protein
MRLRSLPWIGVLLTTLVTAAGAAQLNQADGLAWTSLRSVLADHEDGKRLNNPNVQSAPPRAAAGFTSTYHPR